MFNLFKKEKTELYYVQRINFSLREDWKSGLDKKQSLIRLKKQINNMNITKDEHPFLYQFKKEINQLQLNTFYTEIEIDDLMKSFQDYKRELIKPQ